MNDQRITQQTGILDHNFEDAKPDRQDGFQILVQRDLLYFRVFDGLDNTKYPAPGPPSQRTEIIQRKFFIAFNAVWNRVAETERSLLRQFWAGWRFPSSFNKWFGNYRPIIMVFADEHCGLDLSPFGDLKHLTVANNGHELNYSCSVAMGDPEQLRLVIAKSLFKALRYALKRELQQFDQMVDTPFYRWEAEHPNATESVLDRKFNSLKRKFQRVYDAEESEALRRWGFEFAQIEPASSKSPRRGKREV